MVQRPIKNDVSNTSNLLGQSLELPCGAVLKNRLTKSAMSDSLGDGAGDPTEAQNRLYERWAEGGVALSLIGEVQGDFRYPEKPGNLVLGPKSNQKKLRSLASRGQVHEAHLWPQLGHAGALSHLPISRPKGPSALNIEGLKCEGMSVEDIRALPEIYARAAVLAKSVGFSGVQIHSGHGFLFNQFTTV
jgi:2,4-dienoyl-CoA reductase-like NADH-dependent reductase (Old Yellow Enzyme family)